MIKNPKKSYPVSNPLHTKFYDNGDLYHGQWNNRTKNGFGRYYSLINISVKEKLKNLDDYLISDPKNFEIFIGTFKNGLRSGWGIEYYKDST